MTAFNNISNKTSIKQRHVTVTLFRCQLAFAAILWVNWEMFATVISLCWQVNDHTDIFINQRIELCLNITINLRPLTPRIMPYYTHKMATAS